MQKMSVSLQATPNEEKKKLCIMIKSELEERKATKEKQDNMIAIDDERKRSLLSFLFSSLLLFDRIFQRREPFLRDSDGIFDLTLLELLVPESSGHLIGAQDLLPVVSFLGRTADGDAVAQANTIF